MSNSALMAEISSWSIEAKDEDSMRYFFHFEDVGLLENGSKNYVIGRKGTGKTAIAEYLHGATSYNRFSRLLSFKNFPFNNLYSIKDPSFNRPNQYITIWVYVIYNYICSMMAENEVTRYSGGVDLKKEMDFDVPGALAKSVKKITSTGYNLSVLGVGGGISTGSDDGDFDFSKANEALEDYISSHIDGSEYFVIFDELDEDYRDVLAPDRREQYFELLIGLFKAVQVVRSRFRDTSVNIRPVVLLRDDIFDLCRDHDKNKWLERSITLKWNPSQLRELAKYRLSQALKKCGVDASPSQAWNEVFQTTSINFGTGGKKRKETFSYLLQSTFLRPRDVISYVRECARVSKARDESKISNLSIKEASNEHSAYMRREVIDEVYPIIDDISEIIDLFSKIRKPILTRKEFDDRYRAEIKRGNIHNRDNLSGSKILELLYHFNVVGNVTSGGERVFRYNSDVGAVNFEESLCIHKGLLRTLRIM